MKFILTMFLMGAAFSTFSQPTIKKADKAFAKGNFSEALTLYSQASEADPKNPNIMYNMALCHWSLKNYEACINLSNRAIQLDSTSAPYYFCRAKGKNGIKDYAAAIADYSTSIKLDPRDFSYFNRGICKAELKNFAGAINDYSKVLEINPKDVDTYVNRALCKEELKDFRGAIDDYSKALEINPQDGDAYAYRASCKDELKDFQGAIDDYNQAIKINPKDFDVIADRAYCKEKLEDFKGAIEDYDKAIQLNPKGDFYFDRANAKDELKDYQGALEDYTKAIGLNPKDPGIYYNRGLAKSMVNDYKGTIEDCTKAIELSPSDPNFYFTRAYYKTKLGDRKQAILDYLECLSLDSEDSVARLDLSELYLVTGEFQQALLHAKQTASEVKNLEYEALALFFICVSSKLQDQDAHEAEIVLRQKLASEFSTTWSFTYVEDFIKQATIAPEKKKVITDLIELFKSKKSVE